MRIYALDTSEVDESIDAKLVRTLKPHSTPVVVLTVDPTSTLLATGGADGVVKVWDIRGGFVTHTFHGHSGVVSALHFFVIDADSADNKKTKSKASAQAVVTGSDARTEGTIGYRLASGGEDGKIKIWDLHKRKVVTTLDSHVSIVRSLSYSQRYGMLLSASRDKTAILWDARVWQLASTIAVFESIESAGFLRNEEVIFTAGESARLRLWSSTTGTEVTEEQEPGSELEAILDVLHYPELSFLLTIHADQTLTLLSLSTLSKTVKSSARIPPLPVLRRISGTHDEVIDLAYIGRRRDLLALATNLEDLRIISLRSSASPNAESEASYFGADVALLKGHDDIIITIDTDWSGHWLATGAKDNVAKLWRLDTENDQYTCYATFTGHAESIGAVSLPSATPAAGTKEYENPLDHPPKFLITGSQDRTIKRWDISPQAGKVPRAAYTRKAHDKDINAIDTSPSSTAPMFASASQDRTVKIWDVESGEAMGVLRGHKRGVWSVAFSPSGMPGLTTTGEGGASTARGMVVTGSGDKTVRIWNLTDYSCLRTFEGHVNSILKVVWLPPDTESKHGRGVQVASAAGDGLVKIWDAQSSECAATLDNHIDRVWALAVRPAVILSTEEQNKIKGNITEDDEQEELSTPPKSTLELVSGSADSTLTFWHDTTASTALQASTQATARIEQDQELQNHIRANNYREAIVLALQLNHPKRLLELFSAVVNGPRDENSFTGKLEVDEVLSTLSNSQLWTLLMRIRDWNANGRTFPVAQRLLYAINCIFPKQRLLSLRRMRKDLQSEDEELANAMADLSTKKGTKSKESVKDVLDALLAYTDRHYSRHEKTAEERFVLLWALQEMDDVSGEGIGDRKLLANGHGADDVLMLDS